MGLPPKNITFDGRIDLPDWCICEPPWNEMVYSFVAFVVWGYAKPKKAERDLRAELGVLIRIGKLPLFLEEGKEKTQAYLKAAIDDVHLGLDIVEEIERRNPPGQAARLQTMKEVIAKKRGGPAEGRG